MATSTGQTMLNGNTSPSRSYPPINASVTETLSTSGPDGLSALPANQPNNLEPASATSSNPLGGPLSSHPVSPAEEQPSASADFPSFNWSRDQQTTNEMPNPDNSVGTPSSSAAYHARAMAAGYTTPPLASTNGHAAQSSEDLNNFDPAMSSSQPTRDTSRRPSFVERFFPKLRSSSSYLRSRSKSSLGQYNGSSGDLSQIQKSEQVPRGTKRPGSSSLRPESRSAGAVTDGATSNTFPRLVRKKSMELLSSARRRSGMWGREDSDRPSTRGKLTETALEEERRLEQLRQADEPPPRLPGFGGLGGLDLGVSRLDGEEMFGHIGR